MKMVYIKPEIEMVKFSNQVVITTSGIPGEEIPEAVKLKDTVGGNTAVNYGAQDISIFD